MGDMVTVCDPKNPGSLKEKMSYKIGMPICIIWLQR